ncbi:MAG: hypothetical protein J6A58_11515 [Oscillospiraceae bacterium]|nr:hypothetical protein [Oscillospiraceae bacterium]
MDLKDKLDLFLKSVQNKEHIGKYRDPQEFMGVYQSDEASEVYSCGMFLFELLFGKDFFEYISTPSDEYFMMADTEGAVIERKYICEEYAVFSDILEKMTMYKRENRISLEECIQIIEKAEKDLTFSEKEKNPEKSSECSSFPYIEKNYDYGIILNNKRSGRIQFVKLLDNENGSMQRYEIPVDESGTFKIAVSRRHKSKSHITNPSSMYGDCIEPYALISTEFNGFDKLSVELKNDNSQMSVKLCGIDFSGKIVCVPQENIKFCSC